MTEGRTDGRADGRTDGRAGRRADGRADGRTDERTGGRTGLGSLPGRAAHHQARPSRLLFLPQERGGHGGHGHTRGGGKGVKGV